MMYRPWGGGGIKKGIYKYDHKRDEHRMGGCDWLPKDGDICICTDHSGDYFSDYFVVREVKPQEFKKVGIFSAYNFSEQEGKLSERIFHLLLAGETINSLELKGEKVAEGKKD